MKAADAIFLWTPDRAPFQPAHAPFRGEVMVTTIPEPHWAQSHPCSEGSCSLHWKEASDADRLKLAEKLARQMIDEDNIPRLRVKEAFAAVEEFKQLSSQL